MPEGNSSNTLIALPDPRRLLVDEQQQGSLIDRQSPTSGIVIAVGTVSGSHFGLSCIIAVVRFVIDGVVSMRAAARMSGIVNQLAGGPRFDYPSRMTVQNFLLRIGLYLLQSVSPHHDWIWIVDHTFSVGTFKVMIVLGIRHSQFIGLDRPLVYRDLTVIAILAVETSNGEVVKEQCESGQQFDRLPSSSEILESMMGRAKRLLSGTAEGTTNSLTGQILSLVACTREITPSLVRAALSTVSIKCVSKWFSDNFGRSVNSQRSQDLTPTPADQNLRKPKTAAIPNF